LQSLGKDEFSAELEVILRTILSAAVVEPEARDIFKIIENIFQEEGLDFRELWAEVETEEERRLNQLFQLYFP
jgi:hypothetical protein